MSYGLKYWFEFYDRFSRTCKAEIYQDGYSGSSSEISRSGDTPVRIIYDASDDIYQPLIGSECTLEILSQTNMQYAEFLTVARREYFVKILQGTKVFWAGFVVPEGYQEKFSDPPYIVGIKAVDIIGDLKNYDYFKNYDWRYYDYTFDRRSLAMIVSDILYDISAIKQSGFGFSIFNFIDMWENSMKDTLNPLTLDQLDHSRILAGVLLTAEKRKPNDILSDIFTSFNARCYLGSDGCFDIMDIGKLVDSTLYYRVITSGTSVTDRSSITDHQLTVGRFDDGDDTFWVEDDQILSSVPGVLELEVVNEYILEQIVNGDFDPDLIEDDQPLGWTCDSDLSDGKYELRDDGLLITEFSSPEDFVQSFRSTSSAKNRVKLKVDIETDGQVHVEMKAGGSILAADGSWGSTGIDTDESIDILSDTISGAGYCSITISVVSSTTATYAKVKGVSVQLVAEYPDQLPERTKWVGEGDDGNMQSESIKTIIGDVPSDSDVYNKTAAYRNWLEVTYYDGVAFYSDGATNLWKRSTHTHYKHLLDYITRDRIKNKQLPSLKVSGSLISKDMTFRHILIIPDLSNKKFIKGQMTFDMKRCKWTGDWIELKGYYDATLAVTDTIPSSAAFDGDSGSVSVDVNDSDAWAAELIDTGDGTSWVTLSASSGTGDGSFSVTIAGNTSYSSRSCTLRVYLTDDEDIYEDITIAQDAAKQLEVSPGVWSPGGDAESQAFTVTAESGLAWSVTEVDTGDGVDWISESPTSGTGSGSFTATTTDNTSTSYRQMTLRVSATGAWPVDIVVKQDPQHSISAGSTSLSLGGTNGDTVSTAIDVNPDTLATTIALVDTGDGTSWCTLSHSSATGDFTLTITAASDNDTGSTRSCQVKISDDSGEASDEVITVTQSVKPE